MVEIIEHAVVLLISLVYCIEITLCTEEVTLQIPNGKILGTKMYTVPNNNAYYAFKGLRYSAPMERFKLSKPVGPWKGVYDARKDKGMCPQYIPLPGEREDCLFLNVFTPKLPSSNQEKNLTVMFWVHGGLLITGNGLQKNFGPDYFIDHNVIIVTTTYRLGIYGFLCDGEGTIPCNLGLKDVVLAMQWVKENIQYFGGDPDSITAFGESAGAVMISYLTTSPLVTGKGYFKRAILESGNSLSPWLVQRNPKQNYDAFVLSVGCIRLSSEATLNCLRERSVLAISAATIVDVGVLSSLKMNIMNGITYSLVIEDDKPGAVIVEGSYNLLSRTKSMDVELFVGTNSEEALFGAPYVNIFRPIFIEFDLCRDIIVPVDMYASQEDADNHVAPTLWEYYFQKTPIVLSAVAKIVRYASDGMINKPHREYFTLLQNKTKSYCYVFSYSSKLGLNGMVHHKNYTGLGSVGHLEELYYIFRSHVNDNKKYVPQAYLVRERMVRMWSNFAKTGNPTPNPYDKVLQNITLPAAWIDGTDINCIDIGYNLQLIKNPFEKPYQMWKRLYTKYGHPKDSY